MHSRLGSKKIMSTIIEYAEKHNISLTNNQKDKLISIEVMLNLSDIIVTRSENSLTINTPSRKYHIFKISEHTFRIFIRGGNAQINLTQHNLISSIEFCINDLKEKNHE